MVSGVSPAGRIEHHGEGAGLAGKDHRAPGGGIEGDVVAALREVDGMQDLAGFRQDRRAIGAVAFLERGGEHRVGGKRVGAGRRRQRRQEDRAGGLEEIPAVDEPHGQSPSSEEKPAVRPSALGHAGAEDFRKAGRHDAEIGEPAAPFRVGQHLCDRTVCGRRSLGGVAELEQRRLFYPRSCRAARASPRRDASQQRFHARHVVGQARRPSWPSARTAPASACPCPASAPRNPPSRTSRTSSAPLMKTSSSSVSASSSSR